jgi:hypothetical protein
MYYLAIGKVIDYGDSNALYMFGDAFQTMLTPEKYRERTCQRLC